MENIEAGGGLMYFVAHPDVLAEYGVTAQGTPLASGNALIHVSHCGTMAVRYNGDLRVLGFDQEGIRMYLEYVDGYAGDNNE